jgi:hypothetical protein
MFSLKKCKSSLVVSATYRMLHLLAIAAVNHIYTSNYTATVRK